MPNRGAPEPNTLVPSLNVMGADGAPPPGASTDTLALRYTDCPLTEEFGDALAVTVVDAGTTVIVAELDDVRYHAPPEYFAMIVCEPAPRLEVAMLHFPYHIDAVPTTVAPSVNVTVPSGDPAPGAMTLTVAESVMGWPKAGVAVDGVKVTLVSAGRIVTTKRVDEPVKVGVPE